MRMWMVDPSIMCDQHLRGEHCEMHMFVGTLRKQKKVRGYLKNNLFEPERLKERHDKLASELIRRGCQHMTPLEISNEFEYLSRIEKETKIDVLSAKEELFRRCEKCKERSYSLCPICGKSMQYSHNNIFGDLVYYCSEDQKIEITQNDTTLM